MDELEISGKRYISSRRAAREHRYHSDYIGQLIRSGKITGKKIGRSWYVEAGSLAEYFGAEKSVPAGYAEVATVEILKEEVLEKEAPTQNQSPDQSVGKPEPDSTQLVYGEDSNPLFLEVTALPQEYLVEPTVEEVPVVFESPIKIKKIPDTRKKRRNPIFHPRAFVTLAVLGALTLGLVTAGSYIFVYHSNIDAINQVAAISIGF